MNQQQRFAEARRASAARAVVQAKKNQNGHKRRRFLWFGKAPRERIVGAHEFRPVGEDVYKALRY